MKKYIEHRRQFFSQQGLVMSGCVGKSHPFVTAGNTQNIRRKYTQIQLRKIHTHNQKREEKDAKEKWVDGVCLLTTRLLIDLLALGKEGTAIVSLFENKIYPQIERNF